MRGGLPLSVLCIVLVLFLGCCLVVGGCPGSENEGLYTAAEGFWERKMYGLAAQNYEQFALQHPGHPRAEQSLYKAGFVQAYFLLDFPRAIQLFHRLTVLHPESPYALQAHLILAETYSTHLKEYPRAIAQYERIIELQGTLGGETSRYYYQIARCHFLMGDRNQALGIYERICRESPGGDSADDASYQIGYLQFLEGRMEEAERAFRVFLEKYPESPWTFDGMVHLAGCLEKQHRGEESREIRKKIRERFPGRFNTAGMTDKN
jgi:TolA-binding protein